MTNEEIDAEIARLTALKEQNSQAQTAESNKPADGIYNPADYINNIANKMNKQSIGRGDGFSKSVEDTKNAGRRTGFEKDKDGTPLPETAYEWITQQLNEARARGPVNKYTLKAIENGAKVRYNVPANFNISGPSGIVGFLNRNTERNMARAINSMPYNDKTQKPAQPAQSPQTQGTQGTQQGTQGTSDVSPKTKLDDDRTAAYKRIKSRHASDADLAMFKDYTEEQLKNIGFGSISIEAIKDVAGNNVNGLSDDDMQFMDKYKQYTQQLSGSQPRNPAALKAMQESEAYKFVNGQANKERYNKLSQVQKEANKVNKQNKRNQSIAAAKQDNVAYGDAGTFGE